jgi:hypothetical protein
MNLAPLAIDWTLYYGGWDMNALLTACAVGAAPMGAVVVVRVGIGVASDGVAFVRGILGKR